MIQFIFKISISIIPNIYIIHWIIIFLMTIIYRLIDLLCSFNLIFSGSWLLFILM